MPNQRVIPRGTSPITAKRICLTDAPWRAILTPAFMQQNTPFFDLEDLIAQCAALPAEEAAQLIECEILDALLRQQTRFAGLHEFLRSALEEWTRGQKLM